MCVLQCLQHDYTGDAFVALTAILHEQLSSQISLPDKVGATIESFTKVASRAIVAATPLLAKGLLKKAVGVEYEELSGSIHMEDASDAAAAVVEELIKNNESVLRAVSDFKSVLSNMAESASINCSMTHDTPRSPLYIFIDELDRCRPTFAIELLERIKHFFDVENCKFIIATDKQQLSHSIKAVYGVGFDSERYLRRFFDAEYSLESTSLERWVQVNVDFGNIPIVYSLIGEAASENYFDEVSMPDSRAVLSNGYDLQPQQLVLLAMAKTFKLSVRDLNKSVRQIVAIKSSVSASFNLLWAAYLVCLRVEAEDLYRRLINNPPEDDVFAEMQSRYPGYYLYTGKNNHNVHSLMYKAISIYHLGAQDARVKLREIFSASEDRLVSDLFIDISNNYLEFKKYPALVSLAHSLE